jgi:small GTP-binding protein
MRKKLVIIGDGAVGKTSLLHAYFKDEFSDSYDATVLETYVKELDIDGKKVEINVS